MKADEFLMRYTDTIITALEDYQRWWDKDESQYKDCEEVLSKLKEVDLE